MGKNSKTAQCSLLRVPSPNRNIADARFCSFKNNKRIIIIGGVAADVPLGIDHGPQSTGTLVGGLFQQQGPPGEQGPKGDEGQQGPGGAPGVQGRVGERG
jgi:hypothetical protein